MELEHQFSVPVPVDQAWHVLLDIDRIAPCMPGAAVESFDGETIVGRVKVKVGPIQVTYAGTAKFTEKDEAARRAVIEANAKEARGAGTAAATITAVLHDSGGTSTDVTVTTDLAITGKPAQFGRGVMADVGNKLLGRFADCLAAELTAGEEAAPAPAQVVAAAGAATPAAAAPTPAPAPEVAAVPAAGEPQAKPAPSPTPATAPTPLRRPQEHEAIDLLETAGLPVLKRVAPVLVGLLALFVVWRLVRRRS
jgi:carbon monoxide dehydrogenase subunit G